jgi:hypothetical protein
MPEDRAQFLVGDEASYLLVKASRLTGGLQAPDSGNGYP